MISVTQLKSIGDIRTTISTHTRSTPRHKGSTYLDILSLGMEKQRLETELVWMDRRRGRIERRLGEIAESMEKLLNEAEQDNAATTSALVLDREPRANGSASNAGKWRRMTIDY
ncbi:MAG: hypothetical protein HYY31_04410 [Chloroflexi bacterium]|nr:hypothetical protein [Chloroflexota bacterium]